MAVKRGQEYIESIKSLGLEAQVMGKRVARLHEHPLVKPSLRAAAATFDCAYSEELETFLECDLP